MRLSPLLFACLGCVCLRLSAHALVIDGEPVSPDEYAYAVESVTASVRQQTQLHASTASPDVLSEAAARTELVRFRAELGVARGLGLPTLSFEQLHAAFAGNPSLASPYGPRAVPWPTYLRQYRARLAIAARNALSPTISQQPDLRAEYDAHPERWRSPDIIQLRLIAVGDNALPPGCPAELTLAAAHSESDELIPREIRAAGTALSVNDNSAPVRWGAALVVLQCLSRTPGTVLSFNEAKSVIISARAAAAYARLVRERIAVISVSP